MLFTLGEEALGIKNVLIMCRNCRDCDQINAIFPVVIALYVMQIACNLFSFI